MAPAKKTQQKMSLGSFLQDESLGSWADEMEDMPSTRALRGVAPGGRTGYGNRSDSTPTGFGGFTDRGYSVREQLPLPDKPPYTAHIGNLAFDVTSGEVQDFFSGCEVTNVRIVEDRLEMKPKGFGYVEFGSVDGLKKALELNGSQLSGRNIRISVADPPKNDRGEAREITDWSRKGPLPDLPSTNQRRVTSDRGGFGGRNFDNMSDAGSERGDRRRSPFAQDDGKIRDFGNWERKGPLPPAAGGPPPSRDGGRSRMNDGPRDRRSSPQWGGSQEGSRPPRREFQERTPIERVPTAAEQDNQWRSKMRPDPPAKSPAPSSETSVPSSPAGSAVPLAVAPATRPRLNLQKRTVSEAVDTSAPVSASTDAKASPFGAARPIDTHAREKEIEEKRELAIRQKKEEDRAKAEKKRQAQEAAKAEKAAAAASVTPGSGSEKGEKENGAHNPQPKKNFEILRKAANGDGEEAGADVDVEEHGPEDQNGQVIDDKAVKPKDVVRDAPTKRPDSAWRKSDNKKLEAAVEPTADALEEDGWSTVPAKTKNNKKGGAAGARAVAS